MIIRILHVLVVVCLAAILPWPATAGDGAAETVAAIYRRAAAGKGDGGGQFLWLTAPARRANFTAGTAALWDRAERATPRGDQSPPGFDPVTDSQDPNLKSFRIVKEDETGDEARVAVALTSHGETAPYSRLRFRMKREGSGWLVDDIASTSEGGWGLRRLLDDHLRSHRKR